ncbi:MAG: hypothetical protein ACFFC7_34940 [Candidatus Hermodarchaeota archaeon]
MREERKVRLRNSKKSKILRSVLVFCLILIFAALFWWLVMHLREREARSFLIQAIESINKQTDFYKKHSEREALENIEEYKDVITNNYTITCHYDTWSEYDYEVVFDRSYGFYVTIQRKKGSLVISDFFE